MDEETDEFWSLVSYVEMSKNREKALLSLYKSDKPLTPTEVSEKLKIAFNNASRALRQLTEKEIIRCINPDSPRFRRYRLTEIGMKIAKELSKDQESEKE